MSFSLVNNLSALSSQTRLAATGAKLNLTIQRLSSGLRINSSGDDAAGLAIANRFRSDISILNQGVRNANDGLSTLQIVDGGLNTISNLLDRAATLSSQSASGTFTGNRDILNAELSDVLGEITREAEIVGLNSGGSNNRLLSALIGGGSDAFAAPGSNNAVDIDLSGAANRVDAASLGLNNLNIGTGSGNVTGAQDISAGIAAAETLTFQNVGSSGGLSTFSVTLGAGASASNVIDAINNDANVKEAGITASLNSSNQLVLTSANFFTVSSDTGNVANQTGLVTNAGDVKVTGAANSVSKAITVGLANGAQQTLSFTGEEIGFANTSKDVQFNTFVAVSSANAQTIADSVNNDTTLREAGVFAIVTDAGGAQVQFVSLHNFNLAISSTAGAANANNNLDNLQNPTAASAGTLTGGIDGAKEALDAIRAATELLGKVQGRVGAGQNRLLQAIDLATSQITNYQAAESRIRDADVSAEAANLSRLSVLQQAGVAALAQANQSSQAVLSLLR